MIQVVRVTTFFSLFIGALGWFNIQCANTQHGCERNDDLCMHKVYYFQCARTCGCKGRCNDPDSSCLDESINCLKEPDRRRCPRFCGVCEGCNDLVHEDICAKNSHRCIETRVAYLCARTCGKCEDHCRNKIQDDLCNFFFAKGYCQKENKHSRIMRDVCYGTCTSGCRKIYDQ